MANCEQCGRSFSNWYGDVQMYCPDCRRTSAASSHVAVIGEGIEYEHPHLRQEVATRERRISATIVLIALNVLVFVTMAIVGRSILNPPIELLVRWGADYGPKTLQGQWWRLLTSTFLHGGIAHLAFNMWALLNLGLLAEVLFGRRNYVLMYVLCGLGGSVASLWWHPTVVGVGASGAIFGIAGALLPAIFYHKNEQLRSVLRGNLSSILLFVLYNILYGMGSARTDNAAHLGGLVTGLVLGRLLPTSGPARRTLNAKSVVALTSAALVIVASAAYSQRANAGLVAVARAKKAVRNGDMATAIREAEKGVASDPEMVEAHYLLGTLYLDQKQLPQAVSELQKAVELDPKFADGQNQLCVALLRSVQLDAALGHCLSAQQLDPDDANKNFNLGLVYRAERRPADAVLAFRKAAELKPDSPDENFYYAVALLENDQPAEAVKQLERVMKFRPEYEGAQQMLEEARAEARKQKLAGSR